MNRSKYMTEIPSIESIIAARNKLLGRPTEIDLSAFSTRPSRILPSRYVYKPASDNTYKEVLADTGSKELRRQVGQNQSLTNFYDSASFYEKQKQLFKPITDKTEDSTKSMTEALGNKKNDQDSFLSQLLQLMRNRDNNKNDDDDEEYIKPKKLQPVVIDRDEVAAYFAHKDINNTSLFELLVDGNELATMGVFKELNLENDIYFMLLPQDKKEYNMIRCISNREHMDQYLSKELLHLLTQDIIMNEPEKVKVQYLDLIDFAIGHELNELAKKFNKGIDENFDANPDEYKKEDNKIQAASQIVDWAKRSTKFREWIAPKYGIDISEAQDFLSQIERESEDSSVSDFKPVTVPKETRTHKPPDTYSPAKEVKREKELKAKSKSKLPVPETKVQKQVSLDPQTQTDPGTQASSSKDIKPGGKGIKVIVIAPNAEDRFKRLQVLLGSKQAGNNVGLDEFTSILDSLLKDGKIDKKGYKRYLKVFNKK